MLISKPKVARLSLTQYGARILSGDDLKGKKKERHYKNVYVVCILDDITFDNKTIDEIKDYVNSLN